MQKERLDRNKPNLYIESSFLNDLAIKNIGLGNAHDVTFSWIYDVGVLCDWLEKRGYKKSKENPLSPGEKIISLACLNEKFVNDIGIITPSASDAKQIEIPELLKLYLMEYFLKGSISPHDLDILFPNQESKPDIKIRICYNVDPKHPFVALYDLTFRRKEDKIFVTTKRVM